MDQGKRGGKTVLRQKTTESDLCFEKNILTALWETYDRNSTEWI